jgi:hypothetical protein
VSLPVPVRFRPLTPICRFGSLGNGSPPLPPAQERGGSSPPDPTVDRSSNGRTAGFGPADRGSNPRLSASFMHSVCRVVAMATRPAVDRQDPGSTPGPTARLVRQRDAAAACPPFKRGKVGSTPTACTTNQASSNGKTSGRLPENRGSSPRAWTTPTKCYRKHGVLVRRRRGLTLGFACANPRLFCSLKLAGQPPPSAPLDQRASVVIALGRSPRERGSIPRLVTNPRHQRSGA